MLIPQQLLNFLRRFRDRVKSKISGVYALVDQLAVSGTNFLTFVVIGRSCGASELGIYSLTFSLLVVVLVTLQSLVSVPYVNLLRRRNGSSRARFSGNALTLVAILAALSLVPVLVGGVGFHFRGKPEVAIALYCLATAVPFTMLREFARRYLFANLLFRQAMLLDVVISAFQIGAVIALVFLGIISAASVWISVGASCALGAVVWLIVMRGDFQVSRRRLKLSAVRHWRFGKWIFASELTTSLRSQLVNWFLMLAGGALTTGLFAASAAFARLLNPFFLAITNVLEPVMARRYADHGIGELLRLVRKFTILLCGVLSPACLVIHFFGSEIMALIFGGEFAVSGGALSLLVAAMFVSMIGVPMTFALRAMRRPDLSFRIRLSGFVTCLLLAPALIPIWKVVGAAAAVLVSTMVSAAVRWLVFRRVVADQADSTNCAQLAVTPSS